MDVRRFAVCVRPEANVDLLALDERGDDCRDADQEFSDLDRLMGVEFRDPGDVPDGFHDQSADS
jgi:hypothetical protein